MDVGAKDQDWEGFQMMERESYHPPPCTPQPSESPETVLGRFPAAVAQWGVGMVSARGNLLACTKQL